MIKDKSEKSYWRDFKHKKYIKDTLMVKEENKNVSSFIAIQIKSK